MYMYVYTHIVHPELYIYVRFFQPYLHTCMAACHISHKVSTKVHQHVYG